MKQKIKEALKTRAKNLGLAEEVFDGVAAFGETIVKEEADIEGFVNSEATMNLLKTYQSVADKARAAAKVKNEQTPNPSDNGNQPNPEPKPEDDKVPAWAQQLLEQNKALAEQNKSFAEKLTAFEATRAKEAAVATLDKFCADWGYAGGFPKERDEAKRIALKVYKAGGEQMNGEQLIAAFREEFDPAVKNKGVTDFSQPFKSDGGAGDGDADFSSFDRAAKKLGWVEPEK